MTLSGFERIGHRSEKEASILLKLIDQANLAQLFPKVKFLDNPQLIEMLAHSLRQSQNLNKKRGLILLGSTGCGKSTTACYLMGTKMKESRSPYGDTIVELGEQDTEDLPKLGFSLGISETTFAKGYDLRSTTEKKGLGRMEVQVPVKFPPHITRETFNIVDFPGFKDTRGTDFEIVTTYSVDHSIKALEAIDAVGLVISYETVTAVRSSLFIEALIDLSQQFQGCIGNPDLEKRMFIFITKQPSNIKEDNVRERAFELLEGERGNSNSDPLKIELLQFFVRQCDNGRVILLNPTIPLNRIDILNKILESSQPLGALPETTLKGHYKRSLTGLPIKLKFSDTVNEAIQIWTTIVLPQFLETTRNAIKEKKEIVVKAKKEIDIKKKNISDFQVESGKLQEENESNKKMLAVLQLALVKEKTELPPEIIEQIKRDQEEKTISLHQTLEERKRTEETAYSQLDSYNVQVFEEHESLSKLKKRIADAVADIDTKTTGETPKLLHQSVPYKEGANIETVKWVSEEKMNAVRKASMDKGTGDLESEPSDFVLVNRSINDTFTFSQICKIDRNFQLIPTDDEAVAVLNELITGTHTLIPGDGFRIQIESCKVEFDYVKSHKDGKRILYGYKEKHDGKPPYPSLKITHFIPNRSLYISEVKVLRAKIAGWEGEMLDHQKALAEAEAGLRRKQRELDKATDSLRLAELDIENSKAAARVAKISELISVYEKRLAGNEEAKQRNERSVEECKKGIRVLERGIEETKREIDDLKFTRQRWALFIHSQKKQLEHSLEMARFYAEVNQDIQKDDSYNSKMVQIACECKNFVEYYAKIREELEKEIDEVLSQTCSMSRTPDFRTNSPSEKDSVFIPVSSSPVSFTEEMSDMPDFRTNSPSERDSVFYSKSLVLLCHLQNLCQI